MEDRSSPPHSNPLPSSPRSPHIITLRDGFRKRGSKDLSSKTGIYRPLDRRQIRLLTISPGKMGTKMCCSLQTATLGEKRIPEYEALSYAWGEPQLSRLIWVNEKILPVTKNLDAALENLRYLDKPRSLWIDAICINQSDLSERGQQVLLMKDIYRDASQVLIWLGLQDEESNLAFDLLESIYRLDDRFVDSLRTKQGRGMIAWKDLTSGRTRASPGAEFALKDLQPRHLSALKKTFSQRSWWKRIWIIQEAVYAKDVVIVCGQRSISWELLEQLTRSDNFKAANSQAAQLASYMETAIIIATLRNSLTIVQDTTHNTGTWSKYSERVLKTVTGRRSTDDTLNLVLSDLESPFKTSLDSLVVVFETSCCSDPRDRIYGLLSLADNSSLEIVPDYNKSIEATFMDATRSITNSSSSLNILAYVHRSTHSNMLTKKPGQPTWVPDFAAAREYNTLISSSATKSPYDASRGFDFDCGPLDRDETSLHVSTIECDIIAEILCTVDISEPDWKTWFREWQPFEPQAYGYSTDGYWRTLMLDITRPVGWPARITANDLVIYRYLFANWTSSQLGDHLREEVSFPANLELYKRIRARNSIVVEDFGDVLGDHLDGWSLCCTSGRRLGWVPNVAREGDVIHVAAGTSLPLVLRKKESMYELVGTAYVHGIMDGEIVDWLESISDFDGTATPRRLKIESITIVNEVDYTLICIVWRL